MYYESTVMCACGFYKLAYKIHVNNTHNLLHTFNNGNVPIYFNSQLNAFSFTIKIDTFPLFQSKPENKQ